MYKDRVKLILVFLFDLYSELNSILVSVVTTTNQNDQ